MTDCGHLPPKAYECVQCLLDKIESHQKAIWDLQEMYSELEVERNNINGKLHKAYDLAAQTVQECGCRCQPNRRKCDLCDAADAVLLLKDERNNANN